MLKYLLRYQNYEVENKSDRWGHRPGRYAAIGVSSTAISQYLLRCLFFIFIAVVFIDCSSKQSNIIEEIKIGTHNNNELKIQIDVTTNVKAAVLVEYWPDSIGSKEKMSSLISNAGLSHSLVLCNIIPKTN